MPAISASAPGKIILLGEHAVVYGRPALAVPLAQLQARAMIMARPDSPTGLVNVYAPDVQLRASLADLPENDPLARVIGLAFQELGWRPAAFDIKITSSIPVAAGLGSGAAVSVAILRAISAFAGQPFTDETVNRLAFEVEKLHHGAPSGIDNTVVTFSKPVYFIKGKTPEPMRPGGSFTFVVADTGEPSHTAQAVGEVRQAWQADKPRFESLFDQTGKIVGNARQAIEHGEPALLGEMMDNNQVLLEQMGVSTPGLEKLILAARQAGALGAKLSGAGKGGNMIALVQSTDAGHVSDALKTAGAVRVLTSEIHKPD